MKEIACPHCGQTAFTTVCTDCQAEGIKIQEVKSIFHIGRCHRCGHLDDEPCSARIGSNKTLARAWQKSKEALRGFRRMALEVTERAS